jgi:hypothetical protein
MENQARKYTASFDSRHGTREQNKRCIVYFALSLLNE